MKECQFPTAEDCEEGPEQVEEAREVEYVRPEKDSATGSSSQGKHRSHWKGVLERRQNHRLSRISAATEKRIPKKMTTDIKTMERL
uniref:Uncharacterized protein n=1 Tax=Nelumbo nucifera TaxID=4432 RepID=A0A822Y0C7_NELNU|nr:TPA_asm: hypothetical protein HUJ06_026927 [Nelumbo nucifera]